MDLTTKTILFFLVLLLFTNESRGLTVTLSSNPSTGILEQGGVELICSYQITSSENVLSVSFLNGENKFLASLFPSNLNINASYQTNGKYLDSRTTLTNPGTGSSSAVLTFNTIDCVDEQQYSCKVVTAQNSAGEPSNSVGITVKGNPAAPDGPPTFVPSAGIEEGQNITFTCTGNVGKPQGRFRWIRFRGTQQQIYDSETTTAVVMPGTCTFQGTSTFTMVMTPEDKGVVIRCQVIYDNQAVDKLYTMTTPIDVYYSVRDVTVSQPANAPPSYAEGAGPIQLTCSAQGNPVPTSPDYTWYKESNMSEPIGTGKTYTIQNVVVNETDYYICVVQNSFNGKTFNASARTYVKIDFSTTPAPTTTPSTSTENQGKPTQAPLNNDNGEGLGTGAIAGIAVGCAILVIIVIVIIIFLNRRGGSKDNGSSIDEPPEKPRNNLSFVDTTDALGDKNGPFNNQIHYADLTFEDRPRSRKPLQLSQDSDLDHTPYAQVMMPRV